MAQREVDFLWGKTEFLLSFWKKFIIFTFFREAAAMLASCLACTYKSYISKPPNSALIGLVWQEEFSLVTLMQHQKLIRYNVIFNYYFQELQGKFQRSTIWFWSKGQQTAIQAVEALILLIRPRHGWDMMRQQLSSNKKESLRTITVWLWGYTM